MHAEVFWRKYTDICHLFWNVSKNRMDEQMDRSLDRWVDSDKIESNVNGKTTCLIYCCSL